SLFAYCLLLSQGLIRLSTKFLASCKCIGCDGGWEDSLPCLASSPIAPGLFDVCLNSLTLAFVAQPVETSASNPPISLSITSYILYKPTQSNEFVKSLNTLATASSLIPSSTHAGTSSAGFIS